MDIFRPTKFHQLHLKGDFDILIEIELASEVEQLFIMLYGKSQINGHF